MEYQTFASLCPICSQTLQLRTSEPHPTCDGVDILTYQCEECGRWSFTEWPSQGNGPGGPAFAVVTSKF